jgi:hypothetical protein
MPGGGGGEFGEVHHGPTLRLFPVAAKAAKPAPDETGAAVLLVAAAPGLHSGEPGKQRPSARCAPAARVAHNVIVSVWAMLEECVSQLDEPFRRSEVMGWFRRHYPEVKETTVAAHIYAATANAVNRVENHPYLGRRPPLLRRIDHGLYVRAAGSGADADFIASNAGVRQPAVAASAPRPQNRVHDRARGNVEALVDSFDDYVLAFEASNIFSGPSVYFHRRAIERRRLHGTAEDLLADELFLEYVYAVLPSWGMHRMGAQRAKVTEFGQLVTSIRAAAPVLGELWPLDITQLDPGGVPAISEKAWRVISSIRASTSETQIVAGTKVLHHVLPDLIPPIDRQYTFRFFTGQKAVHSGDRQAFLDWFPYLAEIGRRCRRPIDAAIMRSTPMATGRAKIIDNAIIGFMLTQHSGLESRSSTGRPPVLQSAV